MLEKTHLNIGLNYGGLGDQIARAPAVNAVLQDYPFLEVTLFVFPSAMELYHEWFSAHPRVRSICRMEEFDNTSPDDMSVNFDNTWQYQLGMHVTDHAYLTFTLTQLRRKLNYLPLGTGARADKNESKLVCLTPNFTALSRSLHPLIWNDIICQIIDMGLTPVLLGSSGTEFAGAANVSGDGCLDLRDKTSLLDAVDLIEKSLAVIGIDNGLIHLAACTKTPIIVAYSTQTPENRLPHREEGVIHVVMPKSECQGCEVWLRYTEEHNFKNCYKGTYDCVKSFSAADFISPLKELLK